MSLIQIANPSDEVVRVELDGGTVELTPGTHHLHAFDDREVSLANLSQVALELSWVVGYDRIEDHPDYVAARARRLGESEREQIIHAWQRAFVAGAPYSVPRQFSLFDPLTLANRSEIELSRGFTTLCPGYQRGGTWADGNARVDLANMTLRGLDAVTNGGDPTFSDNDRSIAYKLKVELALDGTITINQPCCLGFFGYCVDTVTGSARNRFEMKMKAVDLSFDAVVVEPTGQDPLRVSVTGTRVKHGGVELTIPNETGLPDWLTWLVREALKGQFFRAASEEAVVAHLEQGALRSTLESVMNAELASPSSPR